MIRQISYLEPELRPFTGQEKVTFENSNELLERRYIDENFTDYVLYISLGNNQGVFVFLMFPYI